MKPLNIITDNIPQIYPYKKKNNISDNFEKDNNKSEEKKKDKYQLIFLLMILFQD